MTLAPGTRLGPYEIGSPAGAGGMGEVYRARDTRLDRTVAVKILPRTLAADPQFRARFDREARVISSLEHPNICALYDVGRSDATDYLVMQFIEGETLASRLSRGPLPLSEALEFAIGIAAALDYAHSRGIVHRDLKPGNVMLARGAREGHVKLLDFGLAKGSADVASSAADVTAPAVTRTTPLTTEGSIVGTFQYMAPEQIEGQEADTRSDIWAFGCVLFEMLTGARAFEGRSRASLIGSIMKDEPPRIAAIQPLAPDAIDHVVRRCLAKSPEDRWQHIRDVLAQLKWIHQQSRETAQLSKSGRTAWLPWAVAAAALVVVSAMAVTGYWRRTNEAGPVMLSLLPPAGADQLIAPAVSPDGTHIVMAAIGGDGISRLWLRAVDSEAVRLLPHTDEASYPFWSPDGKSIGFFAQGKLKTTTLDGTVRELADAPHGRGGDWNENGVILYTPAPRTSLFRISASGGAPVQVTNVDHRGGEATHRLPIFLPGGRRFLFGSSGAKGWILKAGSLDGGETKHVEGLPGEVAWSDTGHLIFLRETSLVAQAFDPDALTVSGEPFVIAENIADGVDGWGRGVSVSRSGAIAARVNPSANVELTWFGRDGARQGTSGQPFESSGFALSPDASRVAVSRFDRRTRRSAIWLLDGLRGTGPRLTPDPQDAELPRWSPDGEWIAYVRDGSVLARRSLETGQEETLLTDRALANPMGWSADSRALLFGINRPASRADIHMVRFDGDRTPVAVVETGALEDRGVLSPDGKWIAYSSDQTGRREIFVQGVPSDGRSWQITNQGGDHVRWSRDGREIFVADLRRRQILLVTVQPGADFEPREPIELFRAPGRFSNFEVSGDGRRFLLTLAEEASAGSLTVVLNWPALLRR